MDVRCFQKVPSHIFGVGIDLPGGGTGQLAYGIHRAVGVMVVLQEAIAMPAAEQIQRQILVVAPNQDDQVFFQQLQNECLQLGGFLTPVEQIPADDQLVRPQIFKKPPDGQGIDQLGIKAVDIACHIVTHRFAPPAKNIDHCTTETGKCKGQFACNWQAAGV